MRNIISLISTEQDFIIGIFDLNCFCAFRVIVTKESKNTNTYEVVGSTMEGNEITLTESENINVAKQLMTLIEARTKTTPHEQEENKSEP